MDFPNSCFICIRNFNIFDLNVLKCLPLSPLSPIVTYCTNCVSISCSFLKSASIISSAFMDSKRVPFSSFIFSFTALSISRAGSKMSFKTYVMMSTAMSSCNHK